jgi:hypothetical protein
MLVVKMPKLYAVSFATTEPQTFNPFWIDGAFSTELDWIRFNQFQWFVWTDKSRDDLVNMIAPYRRPVDQFVVFAIQTEAAEGFAPTWIWQWLNDKMQKQLTGRS